MADAVVIDGKVKVYCLACGWLEFENGELQHPEHDKILAQMIANGFKTQYAER